MMRVPKKAALILISDHNLQHGSHSSCGQSKDGTQRLDDSIKMKKLKSIAT